MWREAFLNLLGKIRNFNLLNFLLEREIKKLESKIEFAQDMIKFHEYSIQELVTEKRQKEDIIISYRYGIDIYRDKISDIKRIVPLNG